MFVFMYGFDLFVRFNSFFILLLNVQFYREVIFISHNLNIYSFTDEQATEQQIDF